MAGEEGYDPHVLKSLLRPFIFLISIVSLYCPKLLYRNLLAEFISVLYLIV